MKSDGGMLFDGILACFHLVLICYGWCGCCNRQDADNLIYDITIPELLHQASSTPKGHINQETLYIKLVVPFLRHGMIPTVLPKRYPGKDFSTMHIFAFTFLIPPFLNNMYLFNITLLLFRCLINWSLPTA